MTSCCHIVVYMLKMPSCTLVTFTVEKYIFQMLLNLNDACSLCRVFYSVLAN